MWTIILTCLNISTGQFAAIVEPDSDEFTLFHKAWFVNKTKNKQKFLYIMKWLQDFSLNNELFYTYKARGVVIPHSLGVTIGLQQGVGCNDLILQGPLEMFHTRPSLESGQTSFKLFCCMCLRLAL